MDAATTYSGVIRTGCFTESRLLRLPDTDETDGFTYIIQYTASRLADFNRYIELHATELRENTIHK